MLTEEKPDYICAHKFSSNHREGVLRSTICGCFYCLHIFRPGEILDWIDGSQTALCPKCGIDSVIGSNAGFPVTTEFLEKMQMYWFS
ncbi:MAG: cytoplasmic protein [Anaerolineae bacterium]|jgi:hypothetical protein|nr:cytoplasmic protein [Anaerolineae bacterium]